MHGVIAHCRACGTNGLRDFLSLGPMPLAEGLLSAPDLARREPRIPLSVALCPSCALVQIREKVGREVLFGAEYPYYSSSSEAWLAHCRENALELIASRDLGPTSRVFEIACNDGYMLRNFHERGIPVVGADPAPGPAAAAERAGIRVLREFFDEGLAHRLQGEELPADVVIANNVLAHVPEPRGFVRGIRTALAEDGLAVIEVPYVLDLIENCEFDTIYHEHHCYFSATSLTSLFAREGLFVNRIRRLPTHGGSLRVYVEKHSDPDSSVCRILAAERAAGLDRWDYYEDFAGRVQEVSCRLQRLLAGLRARGARIAAYGAAAKGATLLNFAKIGPSLVEYVVDRNRHKLGRFMPGVHLPICETGRLLEDAPDYVLLLAWNFRDEILEQQAEFRRRGGRFVIPLPEPEVV